MSKRFNICVTIVIFWAIFLMAAFGLGKALELVVTGWPAMSSLIGVMIGGATYTRAKEITGKKAE
jgi:hypothetical protein